MFHVYQLSMVQVWQERGHNMAQLHTRDVAKLVVEKKVAGIIQKPIPLAMLIRINIEWKDLVVLWSNWIHRIVLHLSNPEVILGAATHWETANPIVVIAVDHQPEATFHIQRHAAEEVLGQFTALIVEIVLGPIGTWTTPCSTHISWEWNTQRKSMKYHKKYHHFPIIFPISSGHNWGSYIPAVEPPAVRRGP